MSAAARVANLPIRLKILGAFLAILCFVAGLGLTALERAGSMDSTVQEITRNYALAVVYLDDMRAGLGGARTVLARELLNERDKAWRDDSQAQFAELVASFEKGSALYAPTIRGRSSWGRRARQASVPKKRFMPAWPTTSSR